MCSSGEHLLTPAVKQGEIRESVSCVATHEQSMLQESGYECGSGEQAVQGVPKIKGQDKHWSKTIYVDGVKLGQLVLLFIILPVPVA